MCGLVGNGLVGENYPRHRRLHGGHGVGAQKGAQFSSSLGGEHQGTSAWPHVQAWLSWSERGIVNPKVVGSIPSKTQELKFPWIWTT